MSQAEHPDRQRPDHRVTLDDVRQLMGASGVRTGTISSSASMRACAATEIALSLPMIQP